MPIVIIEGRQVMVNPHLSICWGPDEEIVKEQVPLERIILAEKIMLNAHMNLREAALEETQELEEMLKAEQ